MNGKNKVVKNNSYLTDFYAIRKGKIWQIPKSEIAFAAVSIVNHVILLVIGSLIGKLFLQQSYR